MPGKEPNRMQGYVQYKNPDLDGTREQSAPDAKQGLGVFKFNVLKTSHKSTHGHVDSRAAPQDSTDQRPFYDTDASSIGVSSPTASAKHGGTRLTQDVQHGHPNDLAYEAASESEDGSDSESGDEESHREVRNEEVDDNRLTRLDGPLRPGVLQILAMSDNGRDHDMPATGASFPYMKGDSYPETTSGLPSVADSVDLNARDNQAQGVTQATSMRTQLTGPTTQNRSQNRQALPQVDHSQSKTQHGIYARQIPLNEGILEHQAATNTNLAKANQSQVAIRSNGKVNEQMSTERAATNPSVSSNLAHRATAPSKEGDPVRPHPQSHTANGMLEPRRQSKSQKKDRKKTYPEKQQGTNIPVEDDEQLDAHAGIPGNHPGDTRTQQDEVEAEENPLDYQLDDLSRMDFNQLKEQPFDLDPNAREFELPDGQSDGDLNGKLSAVSALDQNDQVNFFKSLPIDDWEQAGDWFITQFSDVLNKLKVNRQEKRNAAKTFENEIEKRHSAVSKKRKQIEDEVNGMKESGESVLKGTPKKTKTR